MHPSDRKKLEELWEQYMNGEISLITYIARKYVIEMFPEE